MKQIHIVGGGLCGSECAFQLTSNGFKVCLHELRDSRKNINTDAHKTDKFAELVCSNSFRSADVNSAVGLLQEEMRRLDSFIITTALKHRIAAGGALAVDREGFSQDITDTLLQQPNLSVVREEIEELPLNSDEIWIFATGPITSSKLLESISKTVGEAHLAFYDAMAPVIFKDSIDFNKVWYQSRYDKGNGRDYINCPLTKEEYYNLIDSIKQAEKTEFHSWEEPKYFDGCLPIEVMVERGDETLRYGPFKPVGLTNPHSEERPYAVLQLRQDNKSGTLYNLVGCQTKMKHTDQKKVFRQIQGLEKAEFARFGGIHRNTFLNSPKLLNKKMQLKTHTHIRFAGQFTGVEGYVESAAMGLLAALLLKQELNNKEVVLPPATTAIGALLNHITEDFSRDNNSEFKPMNVNFGLFPELELKGKSSKASRKELYSKRALEDLEEWKKLL